jgi:serine phosphatase RsbU (regulator of sigma subunit)
VVLPQVKEPNLYATFTGFRLGTDGSVFYALAASPPVLWWSASSGGMTQIGDPQLPVGLLPVSHFDCVAATAAPGDLFVIATDGILEVANKREEEFGIQRLQEVVATHADAPLPAMADTILASAGAFGRQFDDQTMLLIRRL